MKPEQALREFHEFFGLPARDQPSVIHGDELRLRQTLLEEEFDELSDDLWELGDVAYEGTKEDSLAVLAKVYKELADLVYVAYGLDQHLGSKLSAVFTEVHRSNMTKLWDCWECNGRGIEPDASYVYAVECSGCNGTGKRPKYREDGKVLKPPTYEDPNIEKVING